VWLVNGGMSYGGTVVLAVQRRTASCGPAVVGCCCGRCAAVGFPADDGSAENTGFGHSGWVGGVVGFERNGAGRGVD
jgi:hypothetical protein